MVPYGGALYDLGASALGVEDEVPVETMPEAQVAQGPTFTQIPPEREGTPVDQPPTPQRQPTPEELQAAQDDALRQQLAAVDRRMKLMGLTGGGRPAMRMNELQREGFRLQGQALEEMRAPLETETAARATAMQQAQDVGAKYISDLQTLQKRQRGEADVRRAAMAADERRMRETEEAFDASRVIRELADKPVETAALSFAAGLVGALKGAAGDMTPNQILAEVDKAVERDVLNQKTAYDRMLRGMEVRRTNFLDARQMGADEQAALATTAAASLDQFRRAIDFAAQRVGDAQTKAKLTEASGQLKMQQGDLQMRIDEKNAAAAAAQSRAIQETRMRLLEAAQKATQADPEMAKDLALRYDSILKGHKPALDAAMAFGNLSKTLRDAQDPQALKDYWNSSVLKAVNAATDKANAAIQSDKNARWFDVMRTAISEEIGSKAVTAEQKRLAAAAQRLINLNLREVSGGAVTDNELARSIAERVFRSWDGFQDWVGEEYQRTAANVGGLIASNRVHNPALANLLDANYGTGLRLYQEFQEQNRFTKAAQQVATKGKR